MTGRLTSNTDEVSEMGGVEEGGRGGGWKFVAGAVEDLCPLPRQRYTQLRGQYGATRTG